jgi:hypothetical protein
MANGFSAGSGSPPAGSGDPPAGSDAPPPTPPPTPPLGSGFTADSSITADSGVTVDNPAFTSAQYPNVPPMPGVPVLARLQTTAAVNAAASQAGIAAALAAQLGLPAGSVFGSSALYAGLGLQPLDPSYSIVDAKGNPILLPDSAVELEVSVDSEINTHPIELGQFQAYNRVQRPARVRLLLACQGKNTPYTSFLSTLKDLREGTQVVTVALPNDSYDNMALKGFGYSRKAERGAITIWADTQWEEERSKNVVVSAPPTSAPQGAPPVHVGSVSSVKPSKSQQASISNPPIVPALAPPQYTDPQLVAAGINNPLALPPIGNGGTPPSGAAW